MTTSASSPFRHVTHNKLVSVDPGKRMSWGAVFLDGVFAACCSIKTDVPFHLTTCNTLVVERPQIYPGRRREDPNDLIDLAISLGSIITQIHHQKLIQYHPREWKGQVPKEITQSRVRGALQDYEISSLDFCLDQVSEGLRHNMYDAVGIGLKHLGRTT